MFYRRAMCGEGRVLLLLFLLHIIRNVIFGPFWVLVCFVCVGNNRQILIEKEARARTHTHTHTRKES